MTDSDDGPWYILYGGYIGLLTLTFTPIAAASLLFAYLFGPVYGVVLFASVAIPVWYYRWELWAR